MNIIILIILCTSVLTTNVFAQSNNYGLDSVKMHTFVQLSEYEKKQAQQLSFAKQNDENARRKKFEVYKRQYERKLFVMYGNSTEKYLREVLSYIEINGQIKPEMLAVIKSDYGKLLQEQRYVFNATLMKLLDEKQEQYFTKSQKIAFWTSSAALVAFITIMKKTGFGGFDSEHYFPTIIVGVSAVGFITSYYGIDFKQKKETTINQLHRLANEFEFCLANDLDILAKQSLNQ